MIDRKSLHDDLTRQFIYYQHRLDNPMPNSPEDWDELVRKYRSDAIFHNKVASLVSGVMRILDEHIK